MKLIPYEKYQRISRVRRVLGNVTSYYIIIFFSLWIISAYSYLFFDFSIFPISDFSIGYLTIASVSLSYLILTLIFYFIIPEGCLIGVHYILDYILTSKIGWYRETEEYREEHFKGGHTKEYKLDLKSINDERQRLLSKEQWDDNDWRAMGSYMDRMAEKKLVWESDKECHYIIDDHELDTKITILLNSSNVELFFIRFSEIAESKGISYKYKREKLEDKE